MKKKKDCEKPMAATKEIKTNIRVLAPKTSDAAEKNEGLITDLSQLSEYHFWR